MSWYLLMRNIFPTWVISLKNKNKLLNKQLQSNNLIKEYKNTK